MGMFQDLTTDEKIRFVKLELANLFTSRRITLEHAQML